MCVVQVLNVTYSIFKCTYVGVFHEGQKEMESKGCVYHLFHKLAYQRNTALGHYCIILVSLVSRCAEGKMSLGTRLNVGRVLAG